MDSSSDLSAVGGVAASAFHIAFRQHFDDVASFVFDAAGTLDDIGSFQPRFVAWIQPVILGRGNLGKIFRFNPQVAGEGHLPFSVRRVFRVVFHSK